MNLAFSKLKLQQHKYFLIIYTINIFTCFTCCIGHFYTFDGKIV